MSNWHRNSVTSRDPVKARTARLREQGFDDGYAGIAARSLDVTYQQSWRKGREVRDRDRTA